MSEPIPVRVTRYRCPHCARTASNKGRSRTHIARCWENPDARACKTCRHFNRAEGGDYETGAPVIAEHCELGVSLDGRPACDECGGFGSTVNGESLGVSECGGCGGDGAAVKAGPIVHCDRWEPAP